MALVGVGCGDTWVRFGLFAGDAAVIHSQVRWSRKHSGHSGRVSMHLTCLLRQAIPNFGISFFFGT